MADLLSNLLGPLDKSGCLYFYILSVIFLFVFLFLIIGGIVFVIRKRKEINSKLIFYSIVTLFNAFLAYFVNRLLYSMCAKSLS
jgi:hypothetical protein